MRRFYDKSYPEAVEYLLGECGGTLITSPPVVKEVKPFKLPPSNGNMHRVFVYLTRTRGIDKEVLLTFADRRMIYESADYHNAVFVGYDMDGVPRHAHKRGTGQASTYKGNIDSSMPECSFHWHGQAVCFIFLKRRLICCRLSPCTKQVGSSTAMLPAAAYPTVCCGR